MAAPLGPTLGALRERLAVRLGFGAQQATLGDAGLAMDGLLADAQDRLWWMHDWPALVREVTAELGEGQNVLDYPDDCDPLKIKAVWVQCGRGWQRLAEADAPLEFEQVPGVLPLALPEGGAGDYEPMTHEAGHWSPMETRLSPMQKGQVLLYERRDQLFFWRPPEARTLVRLRYHRRVNRFSHASDRVTLDPTLVFAVAENMGREQYRLPGVENMARLIQRLLGEVRAGEHGERKYSTARLPWDASTARANRDVQRPAEGEPWARDDARGYR